MTLWIIVEQSFEWNSSLYINFLMYEKAFINMHRKISWNLPRHYDVPEKNNDIEQNSYDKLLQRRAWRVANSFILSEDQYSSYFLLSTQLAEQGRKMPIKWMAPESLHQRRFSSASDVWMFAVCIWEILSKGVKPFSNLTNAEAVEQIARGVRLERPDKCPHSLYEILLQCWNANPTLRPTFSMLKPRIR
ncbi:unnamed protein product [Schistosoma mattheei]|uniref:Uncharacterized protein n=1 Tax=Schistosoma mattheei TaxID=31246 RepID=A0A183PNW4_9TREM|nr:unnamed protein product [Schistosoma mattheei]